MKITRVGGLLLAGVLGWSAATAVSEESKADREVAPAPGPCDPSYPSVCIPPPPPDLDCGDIPHRRFRVIGKDPHRFDRDRDGIGCES